MSVDPDDDLPVLTDVIVAGRPPRRLPDPPAARAPAAAPVTQGLADELTALAWDPVATPPPPAPHPGTPPPPAPDAPVAAPAFGGDDSFARAFAATGPAAPEPVATPPPAPHPRTWGDAGAAVAPEPGPDDLPDWLSLPLRDETSAPAEPARASVVPVSEVADAPIAAASDPIPDAPMERPLESPRADMHHSPPPGFEPRPDPRAAPGLEASPESAQTPDAIRTTEPQPAAAPAARTAPAAGGTEPGASTDAAAPAPVPHAPPVAPATALAGADLDALTARLAAHLDAKVDAAAKALRAALRAEIGAQVHAAVARAGAADTPSRLHAGPDRDTGP